MKKHYLLIAIISLSLFPGGAYLSAQDKLSFSPDKEAFNNELEQFFDKYGTAKSKELLKEFNTYSNNTELEENEWITIAGLANMIISRNSNSYLLMSGLIEALVSFQYNPDRPSNFQVWARNANRLLNLETRKTKDLEDFFSFTVLLHKDNYLFKSRTLSWAISTPDYKFMGLDDFFVQTGKINLVGLSGMDSSRIQDTYGKYYPSTNTWMAKEGKISWEKVGIDNDLVYVNVLDYQLDLSKSVFTLDSVNLIDKRNFQQALPGRFEDKISVGMRPERSGYPRFYSYGLNYRIKSVFDNMDYKGGYSLEGLKIIGSGRGDIKGELMVFHSGKPIMRLTSNKFVFDEGGAKGLNTGFSMFLEADSILHPGLYFQFKKDKNELILMRDGTGSSKSKFFDTYHQMTIDVGMMKWSPGDSKVFLSGMVGSLENNAVFESADFFSLQWFSEIQMADLRNPLVLVKQCADVRSSRYYYSNELAEFMSKPLNLVEELIINMSYLGFVRFNPETKMVQVLQRTYDFLNQHAGLKDYDIIKFRSDIEPPNPNAVISLSNGIMEVFGVQEIDVSNSRNVMFFPSGNKVIIEKGRDMKFGGRVEAGLLTFHGSDYHFNYDDFNIDMNQVKSIQLRVHIPLVKDYQETQIVNLSSIIENTEGLLQIDSPANKAGIEPENTPIFPYFRFDTTAYVYYDQKNIQNGAYPRESFFFEINPNTLNGLNDVRFREKLFFPGTFYTSDIFPPLALDLKYRNDNSLGFETFYTPEEGYPVYVDRGTFFNEISMNRSGLRGNGTLNYLGSTIESEKFLFLPDRVMIEADKLIVEKNSSEYGNPDIFGEKLNATWFPLENRLIAEHLDDPLTVYGDGRFTGKIFIEPGAIYGDGVLQKENFSVESDSLTFMDERFEIHDGNLSIFSMNGDLPPDFDNDKPDNFVGNNLSGYVDLNSRMASFRQDEELGGVLIFPLVQYSAQNNSFTWDMDDKKIFMGQSKLTSRREDQESLTFDAGESLYDMNSYTITADSIPWIDVADVRIVPGDGKAVIRESASMDSLLNSTISSIDNSLGHEFRNSRVKINSRKNYSGTGDYVYTDITEREFLVPFNTIGAKEGKPSEGRAKVDTLATLNLSPEFAFIGDVKWYNPNKHLNFRGSYMMNQQCPKIEAPWVRLNTDINPQHIRIPVDSISRSYDGESLYHGFFVSSQPLELYSRFFGSAINYNDHPLLTGKGEIRYDYSSNKYIIENPDYQDSLIPAPVLSLDHLSCSIRGEGNIDLGVDLGRVEIETIGSLSHELDKDSITGNAIMTVNFFLDDKLLKYFETKLNNTGGLQPVDYSRPAYRKSLDMWLGEKRSRELSEEMALMGSFSETPEEFKHTIFLTDLKFKWNKERGSYQSVGKIGIGNIDGNPVNKLVDGYLEIEKKRSGDTFSFYVEFDKNSYFYFYYTRGLMRVLGGPAFEDFNTIARKTKPKKRKLKVKSGPAYSYAVGQYELLRKFLREIDAL